MRIDLHVHTVFSDGRLTVDDLVREAKSLPIDGFVVTDHNTAEVCLSVAPGVRDGVFVGTGMEYTCGCGSDILLYGYPENLLALWDGGGMPLSMDMAWVFRQAARHDLVACLAHPCRPCQPADMVEVARLASFLAAVETVNGKNRFRYPGSNLLACRFAARHGLPGTGGSDCHRPGELGRAYTFMECGQDWSDMLGCLRLGKVFADPGDAAP